MRIIEALQLPRGLAVLAQEKSCGVGIRGRKIKQPRAAA
jgi:hypothetical protein